MLNRKGSHIIHAGGCDASALSRRQLRLKELVQGLLLPLPPEPQRLAAIQIAQQRQEFFRLSRVNLVYGHLPQGRHPSGCTPAFQKAKVDCSYRARRYAEPSCHLPG